MIVQCSVFLLGKTVRTNEESGSLLLLKISSGKLGSD